MEDNKINKIMDNITEDSNMCIIRDALRQYEQERKETRKYTKEDLQTDVDWLINQGVDESEVESFILGLLNKDIDQSLKDIK